VHPRFRTPWIATATTGILGALLAGFLPIAILGELVAIGTLLAFIIVCIAVIVLRNTAPHAHRPFRTPLVPWVPIGGVAVCGAMMYWLSPDTWLRLAVWMFIGLVIFGIYGIRHVKPPRWTIEKSPNP
jgi:APA family basic amino acid/polyamine antiporter